MKIFSLFFMVLLLLTGCAQPKSGEQMVGECADSFAMAYFNYRFRDAARHVDAESEKWLLFAASNVSQEDVNILRAQENGATVSVGDIQFENTEGTRASVSVTVSNYLEHDSIGKAGRIAQEGVFLLKAHQEQERWKIRMEGLPQSGK